MVELLEYPWLSTYDATSCGSNCSDILLEIGKKQDVTVNLNYLMKFNANPGFEVFIDNEDRSVNSVEDYVMTAVKYV